MVMIRLFTPQSGVDEEVAERLRPPLCHKKINRRALVPDQRVDRHRKLGLFAYIRTPEGSPDSL
jgi:hypothetical protein